MNIYLAAPLFNPRERSWNATLADLFSQAGELFLPQRDGFLLKDLVISGLPLSLARSMVYSKDLEAIRRCDVLIAVLDGRTIDEGVAFEIGFATALQKTCLGLKNDDRVLLRQGDNPMVVQSLQEIYDNEIDVLMAINQIANELEGGSLVQRGKST